MADTVNLKINIDTSGAMKSAGNLKTTLLGVGTAGAGAFGGIKTAVGGLAAALAAVGITTTIQGLINDFDDLAKSARLVGGAETQEAFETFQTLKQAFAEAGIEAATFERGLMQTNTRIQMGIEGQKSYKEITDKLGDSLFDMNGELKSGPDLMLAMINALNEGKITTEDFAKVVGGRAGPVIQEQFVSMNSNGETLAKTLADVKANTDIISLESATQAEQFNDTMGRLGIAMKSLLTDALEPLLPKMVQLADDLLAAMPDIIEKVKGAFEDLKPVFDLIGTVLTDLVFPIMEKVFKILGDIFDAISPLIETALPLLKDGFDLVFTAIDLVVGIVTDAVNAFIDFKNKLVEVGNSIVEFKDKTVGKFSELKDGAVNKMQELYNGVTGWFNKTEHDVVGGSIVPDMVQAVLAEFERMRSGTVATTQAMSSEVSQSLTNAFSTPNLNTRMVDPVRSASQAVQGEFSTLQSAIEGNISGVINGTKSIGDALMDLGKTILSRGVSQAIGGLLGGFGGFGGGGGGFFGNLFGGLFANGGFLPAGKIGIAGEEGPEFITGPARITPMPKGGMSPIFNFNVNASMSGSSGTVTQADLNNLAGRVLSESIKVMNQRSGMVGAY